MPYKSMITNQQCFNLKQEDYANYTEIGLLINALAQRRSYSI